MSQEDFVTFSVGPEKEEIKSGVLVLRTLSPVFDKMFNENWNSQKTKVELPDIQPQVFCHFLELMITNGLTVENLNVLHLSVEETLHMLYIADKYDVEGIQQVCRDSIGEKIELGNAVWIYETVQKMNEPTVEDLSLEFIAENAEKVVEDESFTKLSRESLTKVLKCPDMEIEELELFNGVFRWAELQCSNVGLEPNGENIRGAMGEILFLLRFPVMSNKEFFQVVYPKGILTAEEVAGISCCIALKGDPSFVNDCPFDTTERKMKTISKNAQSFKFCPQESMMFRRIKFLGRNCLSYKSHYKARIRIVNTDLKKVCTGFHWLRRGRDFRESGVSFGTQLTLEKDHLYDFQFDILSGDWNSLQSSNPPDTSIKNGIVLKCIEFEAADQSICVMFN